MPGFLPVPDPIPPWRAAPRPIERPVLPAEPPRHRYLSGGQPASASSPHTRPQHEPAHRHPATHHPDRGPLPPSQNRDRAPMHAVLRADLTNRHPPPHNPRPARPAPTAATVFETAPDSSPPDPANRTDPASADPSSHSPEAHGEQALPTPAGCLRIAQQGPPEVGYSSSRAPDYHDQWRAPAAGRTATGRLNSRRFSPSPTSTMAGAPYPSPSSATGGVHLTTTSYGADGGSCRSPP
ncbi:hypothetical protein EDD34_2904 [Myceligenerans xiligouense]|uniref:Uncharacterized protein n=1 Tax=Myceligenerans xiligouense TaxID=253184 RepID=A0A3N4YS89_9MICO|nr:hypothetical protein EDD34_2904 [Myceligenerans xiligouense]